jgi:hypothetical protein
MLPSKTARRFKWLFRILSFGPLLFFLGILSTAALTSRELAVHRTLLPCLLFLTSVYLVYRRWLPNGFDFNAPGLSHARRDDDWLDNPQILHEAKVSRYFIFLWLIAFLALCVALFISFAMVDYSGLRIVFALSASLVFIMLYLMGKHMYPPETDAKASTSEVATNRCIRCGKDLGFQWHYDFESIVLASCVGAQCQNCGIIICRTDLKYGADGEYEPCSKCSVGVVRLEEGSAYSSMVDKARRERRYRGAIREPAHLGRPIVTE